jgi:hypothetical protein
MPLLLLTTKLDLPSVWNLRANSRFNSNALFHNPCRADERLAPPYRHVSVDHRRWNANVSSSLLDLFLNIRSKRGSASPVYSTGYFPAWQVTIVMETLQHRKRTLLLFWTLLWLTP